MQAGSVDWAMCPAGWQSVDQCDICCECQTAVCIGPHHRGKKGSSCRTGGTGARGSARFRPGTVDRERSDSAMDAQNDVFFGKLRGKQNCN